MATIFSRASRVDEAIACGLNTDSGWNEMSWIVGVSAILHSRHKACRLVLLELFTARVFRAISSVHWFACFAEFRY